MNTAFAQQNMNSNDELIAKLAQKFNVSTQEVQAIFDEYKSEKAEAKVSAYLQKLVDKGKITAEQKTAIETKLGEIRVEMKAEKEALQVWAEGLGIDVEYLHNYNLSQLVEDGVITTEQKNRY